MTDNAPARGFYGPPGSLADRYVMIDQPDPGQVSYYDFTIIEDDGPERSCTVAEWETWVRETGARRELRADDDHPEPTPPPALVSAATDDPRAPSVDAWHRMDTLPESGYVLIAFCRDGGKPFVDAVTMMGHRLWVGSYARYGTAYAWRHAPEPPPPWDYASR